MIRPGTGSTVLARTARLVAATASGRDDPDRGFWLTEHSLADGGEPHIQRHDKLATPASCTALDQGDGWLGTGSPAFHTRANPRSSATLNSRRSWYAVMGRCYVSVPRGLAPKTHRPRWFSGCPVGESDSVMTVSPSLTRVRNPMAACRAQDAVLFFEFGALPDPKCGFKADRRVERSRTNLPAPDCCRLSTRSPRLRFESLTLPNVSARPRP
jgi:hypothetical protein